MGRSRNGQAISPARKTPEEVARLKKLLAGAEKARKLEEWRRAKAVLGYIAGERVAILAKQLGVTRGSVNRWLQWYEAEGASGLRTRKAPGAAPRLTEEQRTELASIIAAGPQAAGFTSGVWTGPMVGELIRERYGVSYHNHHVPRLLHRLGFTVQRPRKRLAKANLEAQRRWVEEKLPAIKKKRRPVGVL